jgi:enediyne biosynthesis protein E5
MKSAASATGVSPAAEKSVARRRFHYDSRFTPPILITCILLAGQVSFGFLESFQRTALAIVTSIAIEMLLGRMFTGKWPHVASAYITGISVGILIRSPEFWPYALCSAISITSKYVLRLKGRHIWNPSNFGISAMLFLAPFAVATLSVQWGNYVAPMVVIWVLGCVIIWRLKRFHITATYVASFLILSMVRHLITGHPFLAEVAPLTGPMYQLYVFFMITDPKTTVSTRRGQVIVAILVAVAEMIFRLAQVVHAPYYALFSVGPVALLIDMWWRSRKPAAIQEPATP